MAPSKNVLQTTGKPTRRVSQANFERIDIVVVSYNSGTYLRACVEPISTLPGVRVIVVDNASTDESLDTVVDLPITRMALTENGGFAHGCNAGWRAGCAPFVLLLNPDAKVDQASLQLLSACLADDRRAGVVGPKIINSNGTLALSQRRFPTVGSTYAQAFFLHRALPNATWANEIITDYREYEHACSPEWISGACMLVRRSLLEEINGLDERFFLYCEDMDLCRRIRQHGFDVRYEPKARVVHAGGASAPRTSLLPVLARSRMRYARKHESRRIAALQRVGMGVEAATAPPDL